MNTTNIPVLYQYYTREGDKFQYIINPQESDKRKMTVYNEFINGLYVGVMISKTEIDYFEDNSDLEWKKIY